ncbi:MAG: flagellar regulator YcgR PilZN domain-containing protein [Pseudomonadota bacterium]
MDFQDTQPAPVGSGADDPFAEFRSSHPREVLLLLRDLRDGATPVALSAPSGVGLGATVWTVDPDRGRIAFDVEPGDPQLPGLVEANEATAVAYLDSVKLQFDLHDLVLVRSPRATALQARLPACVYRFQRRGAFRVRTLDRGAPVARLRHPGLPEMQLALRIVDISIGGCALMLPEKLPPLPPGLELGGVVLDLDTDTTLDVALRIQHVTSVQGKTGTSLRLGCELLRLDAGTLRTLQRYIDQTQKRRRLLSLD